MAYDRRKPIQISESTKLRILSSQQYRCAYCALLFGSLVKRPSRQPIMLKVQMEHMIPYWLNKKNNGKNIVAACQICNGLKSNKCLGTNVRDISSEVMRMWQRKGYYLFE